MAHRQHKLHRGQSVHTCTENAHKHLICHLGQELRQAFTGQLTSRFSYPHDHTTTHMWSNNSDYYYSILERLIGLAQNEADRRK